jgi:perosamine synthetase
MKVPQFMPFVDDSDYESIKECFDTNWLTEGPKSKLFVEKLCSMIGTKYGVLAPNGTLALYLGLKAIGIKPGDEVIVPNFTFIASANAVIMAGATPVFVDIDPCLQIDVEDCKRAYTNRTAAIMPVHIFGMAANMDAVVKFAAERKIKIIEDAAQAIGVTWNGRPCGSFGDVGCFSFFADKTITTVEGGLIVTHNKKTYEKLMYLRNQGRLNRGTFIHPEIGFNFRMTDIQAAIGLNQLKKLSKIVARKSEILALYKAGLKDVDQVRIITPPTESNHVPFRVVILCEGAQQDLSDFMNERDVEVRTFFYPLHRQPCFKKLSSVVELKNIDSIFPASIAAFERGLCLPSFPSLKNEQVEYVCSVIRDYYVR